MAFSLQLKKYSKNIMRKKISKQDKKNRILEALKLDKQLTSSLLASKSKLGYRELISLAEEMESQGMLNKTIIQIPKIFWSMKQ